MSSDKPDVRITSRHMTTTQALHQHIQHAADHLSEQVPSIRSIATILESTHDQPRVHVRAVVDGHAPLDAEAVLPQGCDMYEAIQKAFDKLRRQALRLKTKGSERSLRGHLAAPDACHLSE